MTNSPPVPQPPPGPPSRSGSQPRPDRSSPPGPRLPSGPRGRSGPRAQDPSPSRPGPPLGAGAGDVVLPCLDEAAALPWVMSRIPRGWRAIVVDNGSTDGSARTAADLGAVVVHEPVRGFGAACHAGLLAATADVVCFCDCDGSLDPALLPQLAGPVRDGEADLVLGRRRPTARRAWPLHARLANRRLAGLIRRRTGVRVHDLGPMRAARREDLLALGLTDRRSGYPLQMLVRAADAGWRVAETDVPYTPRTGRSKVTGTWRGTWHAVQDMRGVLREPPRTPVASQGGGSAGGGSTAGTSAGGGSATGASAGGGSAGGMPQGSGSPGPGARGSGQRRPGPHAAAVGAAGPEEAVR